MLLLLLCPCSKPYIEGHSDIVTVSNGPGHWDTVRPSMVIATTPVLLNHGFCTTIAAVLIVTVIAPSFQLFLYRCVFVAGEYRATRARGASEGEKATTGRTAGPKEATDVWYVNVCCYVSEVMSASVATMKLITMCLLFCLVVKVTTTMPLQCFLC